jgi:quercetin dioxygenase-like cupin family protein
MKFNSMAACIALLLATHLSAASSSTPAAAAKAAKPKALREPVFAPIHAMTDQDELVYGDTKAVGKPFVVRVRELSGTIAAPHTHTFDENITVLQGTWYFGIGDRFDPAKLHELPAGSFIFIPSGTPMFGYAKNGPVTVQIHGIGPYTQKFCHPLATLDTSKAAEGSEHASPSSFRFRKGDLVVSPQGSGRIRQGYATGNVVEYEVVAADGGVFMAQEHDMKKQ